MKQKANKHSKRIVVFSLLVLTLAVAIYVNWQYTAEKGSLSLASAFLSENTTKQNEYLGEAEFVNSSTESNYFETARQARTEQRESSLKELKEILNNVKSTDEERLVATQQIALITTLTEKENSIETLVKAKGFEDCVTIISEKAVSCVVKCSSDGLSSNQTAQIQDIITSNCEISFENIKIIEIK